MTVGEILMWNILDVDTDMSEFGQQPKQDKKKGFFDLHKMSLSVGRLVSIKKDQQIDELDQAENKLPFICTRKQMKHQCVWQGQRGKEAEMDETYWGNKKKSNMETEGRKTMGVKWK